MITGVNFTSINYCYFYNGSIEKKENAVWLFFQMKLFLNDMNLNSRSKCEMYVNRDGTKCLSVYAFKKETEKWTHICENR